MIDLQAVNKSYNRMKVHNVGFVRSTNKVSHSLTNIVRKSIMDEIFVFGELDHPIQHWVKISG